MRCCRTIWGAVGRYGVVKRGEKRESKFADATTNKRAGQAK